MLNLKFEQVRAFLHIARGGGNKGAANALHLSQPAISARISSLGKTLGAELFERTENARRLSRRGELMLNYAEQLEYLVVKIEREVAEPQGLEGLLRIGVAETIAQHWFPKVLLELKQIYPNLHIEVQVDISSRLLESLESRKLDIAFAHGVSLGYRYEKVDLPPVQLRWYTTVNDPVDDPTARVRLFDKAVITYPKKTLPYRRVKDAVWSRVGHDVQLIPTSSLSAAKNLVCHGVGVAALPKFLAKEDMWNGRIVRFDPGWNPDPLEFAVHYYAGPLDSVTECVVNVAERVARLHTLVVPEEAKVLG